MTGLADCLVHLGEFTTDADRRAFLVDAANTGVQDVIYVDARLGQTVAVTPPAPLRIHRAHGLLPAFFADRLPHLNTLAARLTEAGVVAVGEIGLDRRPGMPPLPIQCDVLRTALDMAASASLPVIAHVVRAADAFLSVWSEAERPAGGMVHGFLGAPELALRYVRAGLAVGFGTGLLNPQAARGRAAAAAVPLTHLLVETDAPHRPGAAVPGPALTQVIDIIAQARQVPAAAIARATAENAARLFFRRPL